MCLIRGCNHERISSYLRSKYNSDSYPDYYEYHRDHVHNLRD